MSRTIQLSLLLLGAVFVVGLVGCDSTAEGPATAPVKGTLTIDGQPADGIRITFSPLDDAGEEAVGEAKNGSFELFSGVQGKSGAVPGKYKVVLAAGAADGGETPDYMNPDNASGGSSSEPAAQKLAFPEKYTQVSTSDKEVEVTSGPNDIKIDITSE